MPYPSVISTLATPQSSDRLNNPSHSQLHQNENTAITEIQTFVGTTSSAVGTLYYDIRSSSSNGGGHIQTADKGGTGQTNYNKGDILVAQSSSVLTKLSVSSTNNFALITDNTQPTGVKWGLPGNTPVMRVYSVAGTFTWTKPSVLNYIVVDLWGGGAGSETSASFPPGGRGGGSGAYARKNISAAALGATEQVKVGIAGLQSSVGGNTSFGTTSFFSAGGGQIPNGGTGNGDFTIPGFTGENSPTGINGSTGGPGADAPLGVGKGGKSSVFGGTSTANAEGYAAGGGAQATGNGGIGTAGLAIVYEY